MPDVTDELRCAYDAVPYRAGAFRHTHPDNLRVVAALVGMPPAAPPTACRVLEIGCGVGGNLLPMAQALPGSTFVGIDLSPRQIETAAATAKLAGITNVGLICQDLLDFDPGAGTFDCIIAHGVYSWVPQVVRDALLRLMGRHLAANGLAYVSYNTLPGWHLRQAVGEMMSYASRGATDTAARISRAKDVLALAAHLAVAPAGYKDAMKQADTVLQQQGDWYLVHEHLAPVNQPVNFHQFVAHAQAHGLGHLAAASPVFESFNWLPPLVQQQVRQLAGDDQLEREQYLDFLHGRAFRASVLCRGDVQLSSATADLAMAQMHLSGQLIETQGDSAAVTGVHFGSKYTDKRIPMKEAWQLAMFRRLQQAWPRSVPFAELLAIAAAAEGSRRAGFDGTVAHHLFVAYKAEVLELWTRPVDFLASAAGDHPRVTPLARLQASDGHSLANLRHENINVSVAMRHLLPLLDGSRPRNELARALQGLIDGGQVTVNPASGMPTQVDALLARLLEGFADDSLLLA